MPYPVLAKETVETMVASWVSLQDEIAAMKKDKKADKKKIAALAAQLDLKGQNISKKLLADIAIAKKSVFEHAAKVDKWLVDALAALKSSKQSAVEMEHTHSTNDMDKAGYAEGFITHLYEMAEEDGRDAGSSWFAYRGGIADKVDKKYVDPYKVVRNEMIVSEKSVKAKRLQIQSLIAQATAVKDAAKRSLLGGLNYLEEHQADAEKLADQLQKDFAIVENGTSQVTDKNNRMHTYVTEPFQPAVLTLAEGIYKEAIAQMNRAKNTSNGMTKNYDTLVKTFSHEELNDPKIRLAMTKSHSLVADAAEKVQTAAPLIPQIATNLGTLQTRAKNFKPAKKK